MGVGSPAGDIMDRFGAVTEGGGVRDDSWRTEAREMMDGFRSDRETRTAEVRDDRAARQAEVKELMGEYKSWFADSRSKWREEAETRRDETKRFMDDLRRDRTGGD